MRKIFFKNHFIKFKFLFVLLILFNTACEKSPTNLLFEKLDVPTTVTIRDITRVGTDKLYACGGDDQAGVILASFNGGENWNIHPKIFDNSINAICFTSDSIGYAVDADLLIYKTVDGGMNWNPFYATSWPQSVNRNLRSISFVNDSIGFACGGRNLGNGVLFRTTNSGGYWSFSEFTHEYRAVCFNTAGTGVMCGYGSLMVTTDKGETWQAKLSGNYFTGLAVSVQGHFWASSLNGDVHASFDDGRTWHRKRNGTNATPSTTQLNCIAVSPSGNIAAAGAGGKITFSEDGHSWNLVSGFNQTDLFKLIWINDHQVITVGEQGGIFKATLIN